MQACFPCGKSWSIFNQTSPIIDCTRAIGGFTSPNQNVDTALYPDDTARQIAEALVGAESFRFDMSDLTPSAFGGTVGQGFWQIMIEFLQNPDDVAGAQQKLEDAAAAAYGG